MEDIKRRSMSSMIKKILGKSTKKYLCGFQVLQNKYKGYFFYSMTSGFQICKMGKTDVNFFIFDRDKIVLSCKKPPHDIKNMIF